MKEKRSPFLVSQKIRFRAARNQFKLLVLRGRHEPNEPQTVSLLRELADLGADIADRTWQDWFGSQSRKPQISMIRRLDEYATQLTKRCPAAQGEGIRAGYFHDLVYGGLMQRMLASTEAANPVYTYMQRAQEYMPTSLLHLHFDAMDAAAWHMNYGDVPWTVIAAIAADRIQQLLSERWSPRSGSVYATFRSDLNIKWAAADEAQRQAIKESLAQIMPDLFEVHMRSGAWPDWARLGVSADSPHEYIHKLLVAIAATPEFLVEDRLEAWSLDLATSALAMHALAWPNRYETMALGAPPELLYWAALYEIFFESEPGEIDCWSLGGVLADWPADWSEHTAATFQNARQTYSALLWGLGLKPGDVCAGLLNTREQWPLVYS